MPWVAHGACAPHGVVVETIGGEGGGWTGQRVGEALTANGSDSLRGAVPGLGIGECKMLAGLQGLMEVGSHPGASARCTQPLSWSHIRGRRHALTRPLPHSQGGGGGAGRDKCRWVGA